MKMKGQSAMEYLMTYGWAILIVAIVAVALYSLGIFNPGTMTGTGATGFKTLGPPTEWSYDTATNSFSIVIRNERGDSITINEVDVTISGVTGTNTTSYTVSHGSNKLYIVPMSGLSINSGDSYSASVTIKYKLAGGTLTQVEHGTLTGVAV